MASFIVWNILALIFLEKVWITLWTILAVGVVALFLTMNFAQHNKLYKWGLIFTYLWHTGSVAFYVFLIKWHNTTAHSFGALTWPVIVFFLAIPVQCIIYNRIILCSK